jgi:protein SCO1
MRFSRLALGTAAAAIALACAGVAFYVVGAPDAPGSHNHDLGAYQRTAVTVSVGAPLYMPALVTADGKDVVPGALQGRWSVVYLGFTSCPDVCPTTLHLLGEVARDPASGVPSGATQILFVTLDPKRDTPERMRGYLRHFSGITGLTGSPDAVAHFVAELGGAYRARGSAGDHAGALFVLDAKGRPAEMLLRPSEPGRVVSALAALRAGGT